MAEEEKKRSETTENLEQMLDQSSQKASKEVARQELTEKQNLELKRLIRLLPFQIFLLVADADDKIDPKEVGHFREFLSNREKHCSNSYTRRMFHATVVNYSGLTNRYHGGYIKKSFEMVEKTMRYIEMCVSPRMMNDICSDLRDLAKTVAEASGGFLGVTSPISKEEQAVIDQLDLIFDNAIDEAQGEDKPDQWELSF